MDWVEQFLHINPDGGSGIFEVALVVLIAAAVVLLAARWAGRAARRPEDGRLPEDSA